ncbi:MAG: META domain-containing protein [Treponema sp.]|nr:META domain-containing protein [Treponema sp.]
MRIREKFTARFAVMAVAAFAAIALATVACASAPSANPAGMQDALNVEWILAEIRTEDGTIVMDRVGNAALFGDIFTLRLDGAMAYGTAMPNTFRGPYSLGPNGEITFGPMASTLMAAFMEPEELSEHEFFVFLYNAFMWDLRDGNFELYATDDFGGEAVLVFVVND